MNLLLWVLQVLAALMYGASGVMKVFKFDKISGQVPSFGALRGRHAGRELLCARAAELGAAPRKRRQETRDADASQSGPLSGGVHRRRRHRSRQERAVLSFRAREEWRAAEAGIETEIGCQTFRATGITAYLKNGGKLEVAQQMSAHESAHTTGLYDRRNDEVSLDEVERIAI